MEEEKKQYVRLYNSLKKKQCEDIILMWEKSFLEDYYNRMKEIKLYCKKKDCDFLSALFLIYKNISIPDMCILCFYDTYIDKVGEMQVTSEDKCEYEYLTIDEIEEFLQRRLMHVKKTKYPYENKQVFIDRILDSVREKGCFDIFSIEANYDVAILSNENEFFWYLYELFFEYINRNVVKEDIKNLEMIIKRIIIERQKDTEKLMNNILIKYYEFDDNDFSKMSDLEKQMYIPYDTTSKYIPIEKEVENPSLDNINQDNDIKNSINIDIEAFKAYFKPNLTSESEDSIFNRLITDLKGSLNGYNESDILAISKIIYECGGLHHSKKPSTPRKWYIEFCSLINRRVSTIKPNQIKKQFKKLKDTYEYIYNQ